MTNFPWDQTIVGWIHITSAATVVGFLFFWLLALLPSGGEAARAAVGRYRPIFWAAAALLLVSGGYTFSVRLRQGYPHFYFVVIYIKIVLYVVLFGLAGVLTKPRAEPTGMQRQAGMWLGICAVICLVILFLSAFLRRVTPVALVAPPSVSVPVPGPGGTRLVPVPGGPAPSAPAEPR